MSTVIVNSEGPDPDSAYWDVGHYKPNGEFDSILHTNDWSEAMLMCNFVNGGNGVTPDKFATLLSTLTDNVGHVAYQVSSLPSLFEEYK